MYLNKGDCFIALIKAQSYHLESKMQQIACNRVTQLK